MSEIGVASMMAINRQAFSRSVKSSSETFLVMKITTNERIILLPLAQTYETIASTEQVSWPRYEQNICSTSR